MALNLEEHKLMSEIKVITGNSKLIDHLESIGKLDFIHMDRAKHFLLTGFFDSDDIIKSLRKGEAIDG